MGFPFFPGKTGWRPCWSQPRLEVLQHLPGVKDSPAASFIAAPAAQLGILEDVVFLFLSWLVLFGFVSWFGLVWLVL